MRTEREIVEICRSAADRITAIALEACDETEDKNQRYIIMIQLAAGIFGACGAQFQQAHPDVDKGAAAMEMLKYVGGLVQQAYTQ